MSFHKLLHKQVNRYLPEPLRQHPDLQKFLIAVNDSYHACERDKEIADRAFSISEEEYATINALLKHELAVKKQSLQKLRETISTVSGQENSNDSDDLLMLTQYLDEQIRKRKTAEEKLKTSQELWHFALEGTGDGVWENDTVAKTLFFSKQFKKMLGYEDSEFKNSTKEWLSKVHPEDMSSVIATGKNYIQKKITSHHNEYRIRHKSGNYVWVLDRGRIFKSNDEKNERIIGTITNITERKKIEEEYKRISVVASANENGVVFTDATGKITWANEGFISLTQYSRNEIIGKSPFELCKGPLSDRTVLKDMVASFENGLSFSSEVIHYRKDGSWFWGRAKGQAVTNDEGKVIQYFAIVYDISGEKASQKKLKEYEERLKIALANVGDNYWEHNFKTNKTYFSNASDSILGYAADEITNEANLWWQLMHHEDRDILKENDRKYKAGLIDHHAQEYRMIHKDGSIRWILDRGMVTEKDEQGLPLKIIGTHIDITRQKQLEVELLRRAHQFESLSENIPGIIYEYEVRIDGTEGLRYVSPSMEEIFGLEPEQFYKFYQYIHPGDARDIADKRRSLINTLNSFYTEARLISPKKGMLWYSDNSSFSYYTPEGSAVFTGFLQDITERKNADHALKVKEEKYRNIIANMNLGLLEVDTNEIIQFTNQSFCDMSGYTFEELIGRKASELFAKGEAEELVEMKNESRKRGISDAYEIAVNNKVGEARWWLISGAPRFNDKDELVGSIGIHLDITDQKRQEYELREAREQAESSANAKQTFLANMSHEIRTPMNAILGMTRQLQKTELDPTQKFYLDTVNNAGEHLMVIINDILDSSKIEAGKLVLESIGFNMKEVLKNVVDVMQHRASEKGILVSYTCDNSVAPVLNGDPFRLKQILFNLTGNSIKFSEKGEVMIRCTILNDCSDSQLLELTVSDNGIGIDKDYQENLFQSFTQEDKSVSRKYGGTGLGMMITKQLTELMGGKVAVTSEKNIGTTITLAIPFSRGNEKEILHNDQCTPDSSLLNGKEILVVEDNEINRLVVNITLSPYGVEITEAVNGAAAVEAVKNKSFDIILMDMQMPVMDGLEATKIIRGETGCLTPIIALTANAIKGESDKCFAAGMNDFISKPFEENDLVNKISKWIAQEKENK